MSAVLQLNEVKVWFGGIKAVDGIDLDLQEGRLYGLVGPNGSGKTTLVNAISGLGPTTSGSVLLDGDDISSAAGHVRASRGIARTFQSIKVLPNLTARDNVLLAVERLSSTGIAWRRSQRREAVERATAALARVGLGDVSDKQPCGTLPYGIQRRVEVARSIATDPRILLLDEPVAGMNEEERGEIAQTLRALAHEGMTQVIIEHDLRLLQSICDELIVMNFGKVIARGEPATVANLPIVQEAYLGTPAGDPLKESVDAEG